MNIYLFISHKQALCYKAHAGTEMRIENEYGCVYINERCSVHPHRSWYTLGTAVLTSESPSSGESLGHWRLRGLGLRARACLGRRA